MAISTTAFGVYFYLMARLHPGKSLGLLILESTGEEADANLAWLALASMAIFIAGEFKPRIKIRINHV